MIPCRCQICQMERESKKGDNKQFFSTAHQQLDVSQCEKPELKRTNMNKFSIISNLAHVSGSISGVGSGLEFYKNDSNREALDRTIKHLYQQADLVMKIIECLQQEWFKEEGNGDS